MENLANLRRDKRNKGYDNFSFRILIVEDHEDWAIILKDNAQEALEDIGLSDLDIKVLKNYRSARELIVSSNWNLLITDIGLDDDDDNSSQQFGRDLIRKAKKLKIPTIAVSGTPIVNTNDIRNILLEDGAFDYFGKKSFSYSLYISRIQLVAFLTLAIDGDSSLLNHILLSDKFIAEDRLKKFSNVFVSKLGKTQNRDRIISWINENVVNTTTKTVVSETVKRLFLIILALI